MAYLAEMSSSASAMRGPGPSLNLPINSYRGPDVNLPWTVLPNLPVDLQLEDVALRLQKAQEERKAVEEQVGSGNYPSSNAKPKRGPGASSSFMAGSAQRFLRVQQDPRLQEMKDALISLNPQSENPSAGSETKAVWHAHVRQGIRKLLDSVLMCTNPDAAERQLDEAYKWYQKARRPSHQPLHSGPGFHDFCAEEVLRHPAPPGSAYFEAVEVERPGRSTSHDSNKFEASY